MAEVTTHPDNELIVNVGSDYRIEPGPRLVTAVATEELLHNDNTAPHYKPPVDNGNDTFTFAKDALGKAIILGKEFSYLDYGGDVAERKETYYIYNKVPVNYTTEFLNDGEPNPSYIPQEVHDAKARGERGDDRVFYDYRWEEVATRQTLEAAVEYCQRKAG